MYSSGMPYYVLPEGCSVITFLTGKVTWLLVYAFYMVFQIIFSFGSSRPKL